MSKAIDRAMAAPTTAEQERAMRWVRRWGIVGGIRSPLTFTEGWNGNPERSAPRS